MKEPHRSVTEGQYAVFYKGEECYGSAKILGIGPSLFDLGLKDDVIEGVTGSSPPLTEKSYKIL